MAIEKQIRTISLDCDGCERRARARGRSCNKFFGWGAWCCQYVGSRSQCRKCEGLHFEILGDNKLVTKVVEKVCRIDWELFKKRVV